jgi:pilus assembly protein Flp/PilA
MPEDDGMSRFGSLRRFLRNKSGATAIEYALIASAIAGVLVGAIATLGGSVKAMWVSVSHIFS